jgi:hypothetical protein
MRQKKKIAIHCILWAIWLFMNISWTIFTGKKQPPIPLAYNILSLVLVFYTTRWMASRYWNIIESNTQMSVNAQGKIIQHYNNIWRFYILRWPFFGVIGIVLAYIGMAWLMDGLFAATGLLPGRYPDFYYYTYSKWTTESFYVCMANILAAIPYYVRQEVGKRFLLEETARKQIEKNKLLTEEKRLFEHEVISLLKKIEQHNKKRDEDNNDC